MPQALVHVTFVRSRLALAAHLILSLAMALAAGWWIAPLWGGGVAIALYAGAVWSGRRCPPPLRCLDGKSWEVWQHGAWQPAALRLHRLGPWIIELSINRHHHGLWPDSASSDALRQLRRALVSLEAARAPATAFSGWRWLARLKRRIGAWIVGARFQE